jgi:1A family penicillin-binding protein
MRSDRENRPRYLVLILRLLGKPLFLLSYVIVSFFVLVPTLWHRFWFWGSFYGRVIRKTILFTLHTPPQPLSKKHLKWSFVPPRFWSGWRFNVLLTVGFVCCGLFWFFVLRDLPQPQDLLRRDQAVTTKIFDRNGELLYKIYKNQNRSIISLSDLPWYMVSATLAIEDDQFYQHPGFSLKGIVRALTKNATSDTVQGGSTITQQLVKNTLLTNEKTITRKLKEFVLSLEVEYYFTKDEILTMYFNEVGYGGTAYGIEEAAWQYFGKSVREVTLPEAALLAGLPQSPTVYSPFGTKPELAVARQHAVLKRMVELKMISAETAETAKATPLVFAQPKTDIVAPHFVMFVKDALVQLYGESIVHSGGLEVHTTLDAAIQQLAETAVSQELERLKNMHVTNAAALVIKPSTGEILAMVGSKNYFDTVHDGQVNVTVRSRQPGSSIKALTYALALQERLITPSTLIDDSPVVYRTPGSPAYAPQNYDGRFHGKVTVRQALANSYNIPAVKTLSQVGVSNLVDFATKMGITTWTDPSRFGLSLTLGGGEVRMVDLAEAYGVFANGGVRVPLSSLISVRDFSQKIDDAYTCSLDTTTHVCSGDKVIDPAVAYSISDILSDNTARSSAFGSHSVLVIPNQQVAVKTGTTNDLRDNWTFGYTNDYLVATWVGNNDNTPMSRVASGITGASPIWQTIMKGLLSNQPKHAFTPPADMVKVTVCPLTQTLTCAECPNPRTEYFINGTQPKRACDTALVQQAQASPSPAAAGRDQLLNGASTNGEQ